ncbi:MAG TPA: MaoC family dehydratase [Gammaproteobacteria bacterium]|jgi:acyl dehydratase|nr:MAG: nodulation protein NodN [Acidithiobacillus sp.]HHZ71742.1 MaoC family dehydratase [Gammaproteobacteria bacterium]HIB07820.1 MaoC family dehydratase [Gammaproteobacteria bacterium]HIB80882.1 MaoC family dehydratase [Gammaproteobacteria bacterium]HIM87104.1 MaoC family dehydratase [Gammaproteobacteria bacterium]
MTKLTTIAADQLQSTQGTKLGISPWIRLSQSMVNQFADITNDHQFIHIDPKRAGTESPFGGTIAHGFLTLSQLTQMAESTLAVIKDVRMSINYGFDRIRFITPVRSDARVRAHFTLELAEERTTGEWTLHHDITVEIEHNERPALSAMWITRQYTG